MIEVEKKFIPEEGDIERVTKGAEFIGQAVNDDTYYDRDFYLTKRDVYIRKRNGNFEMKVGVRREGLEGIISTYRELNDEDAIREELGIEKNGNLEEDLKASGYSPFGSWKTTRRKYKKGQFTIDVDSVDYGYDVVEIELLTENRDDMDEATNKILNFARESKLTKSAKTGKVSGFLMRNYPEEYKEIRKAWDSLAKGVVGD
jgi:predicted adenylyl cyclase CyaB